MYVYIYVYIYTYMYIYISQGAKYTHIHLTRAQSLNREGPSMSPLSHVFPQVDTGRYCADAEDVDPCSAAGYRMRKLANTKCAILKVYDSDHDVVCHPQGI